MSTKTVTTYTCDNPGCNAETDNPSHWVAIGPAARMRQAHASNVYIMEAPGEIKLGDKSSKLPWGNYCTLACARDAFHTALVAVRP